MQAQGRVLPSADAVTPTLLAEVNSSEASVCVNQRTPFVAVGHAAQVGAPAGLSEVQLAVAIFHARRDVDHYTLEWLEHGDFTARGALSAARLRLLALESARSGEGALG